jgi:hypothetical protein
MGLAQDSRKRTITHRTAWGKRFGLTYPQVQALLRLVDEAVDAQTREHNVCNAPDSTPAINAVEAYARELGFQSISWPGLYPLLYKNGQDINLPE